MRLNVRPLGSAVALRLAIGDFGGNKAQAIHDCQVAIHSLRRALYFRLHMDDAAPLDRIP